jgi:two-component system nitrogen regulation sensor histidine kinase GlnL
MLIRRRRASAPAPSPTSEHGLEPAIILGALPDPVIVIDRDEHIRFVNPAAEQFLGSGAAALCGNALASFVAPHSPLLSLVESVWRVGNTISEYDMLLEGPRLGSRLVTIQGALTGEGADMLVLTA